MAMLVEKYMNSSVFIVTYSGDKHPHAKNEIIAVRVVNDDKCFIAAW